MRYVLFTFLAVCFVSTSTANACHKRRGCHSDSCCWQQAANDCGGCSSTWNGSGYYQNGSMYRDGRSVGSGQTAPMPSTKTTPPMPVPQNK